MLPSTHLLMIVSQSIGDIDCDSGQKSKLWATTITELKQFIENTPALEIIVHISSRPNLMKQFLMCNEYCKKSISKMEKLW